VTDVERGPVESFATNPDKPGRRWELSPQLGIDAYNLNVAVLEPGEVLSESGYHYHPNQREFFYVVRGRCQVEVEDDAFRLQENEVVRFETGVVHLVHNTFDDPCRLIAIGSPPEGRRPVHQVAPAADLLEDRYGSPDPDPVSDRTT